MRSISILGSTGSIGTQTLEVIRLFPDRFRVHALAGGSNIELLIRQALEFEPAYVYLADKGGVNDLKEALAGLSIQVLDSPGGLDELAALDETDMLVAAMVGFAGLRPVLAAIRAGKTIALANKETLVVGGELVNTLLRKHRATLIPVDSEHSAIFQCLVGEPMEAVEHLTLTASGGPFKDRPAETFAQITPAEALRHPNWTMGAKITIDSATMMNKGLEVIEARWIFQVEPDRIDVLVHPQSIIHSMVTFADGSTKAQLGIPDMKVPIQYALTYPDRWPAPHPRIDWTELRCLDFEPPDLDKFPCLQLAYDALEAGGIVPAVLNAANEVAVARFLRGGIGFHEIPRLIEGAVGQAASIASPSLDDLEAADALARAWVREELKQVGTN